MFSRPVGGSLTKVSQFEFSQVADEQVVRLQVSVQDPTTVDVTESPEQLEHEDLHETIIIIANVNSCICFPAVLPAMCEHTLTLWE